MKWSWRLGKIAGIDLYVHVTFFLLLGWIVFGHYFESYDAADAAREGLFICLLFGIVVLHELGHALAARRYGIATRDITLLPIGGVARLERMPEDPRQELVVALAGPAVNVVLAVLIFGFMVGRAEVADLMGIRLREGTLLNKLLWVNVMLVVFNMLPAFPMDGGRVLRALLAMRMEYVQATQVAATVGQAMAFLFGFWGLFGNPLLVFIALFVWIGASQEASMVQMKSALGGIPASQAMIRDFRVVSPDDTLASVSQAILNGFQQDFPVRDGNRVVGLLTRPALVAALRERGEMGRVADAMTSEFETVDPNDMLENVLGRLNESPAHALFVYRNGELVGLITPENIGEFLMIQAALKGGPATRPSGPA